MRPSGSRLSRAATAGARCPPPRSAAADVDLDGGDGWRGRRPSSRSTRWRRWSGELLGALDRVAHGVSRRRHVGDIAAPDPLRGAVAAAEHDHLAALGEAGDHRRDAERADVHRAEHARDARLGSAIRSLRSRRAPCSRRPGTPAPVRERAGALRMSNARPCRRAGGRARRAGRSIRWRGATCPRPAAGQHLAGLEGQVPAPVADPFGLASPAAAAPAPRRAARDSASTWRLRARAGDPQQHLGSPRPTGSSSWPVGIDQDQPVAGSCAGRVRLRARRCRPRSCRAAGARPARPRPTEAPSAARRAARAGRPAASPGPAGRDALVDLELVHPLDPADLDPLAS